MSRDWKSGFISSYTFPAITNVRDCISSMFEMAIAFNMSSVPLRRDSPPKCKYILSFAGIFSSSRRFFNLEKSTLGTGSASRRNLSVEYISFSILTLQESLRTSNLSIHLLPTADLYLTHSNNRRNNPIFCQS